MRIGIVPTVNPALGGIYQYSLTMLHALDAWRSEGCEDEFVVFAPGVPHPALVSTIGPGWTLKPLTPLSLPQRALDVLRRVVGEGPHREAWRWLRRAPRWDKTLLRDPEIVKSRPDMKCWLHRCGIDLMLYPISSALSFETGLPYVMAIHDSSTGSSPRSQRFQQTASGSRESIVSATGLVTPRSCWLIQKWARRISSTSTDRTVSHQTG